MPHDPRPRYDILQPLALVSGQFLWLRVGQGYVNPDGTIDAYLDVIIVGHRFRLRESQPAPPTPEDAA